MLFCVMYCTVLYCPVLHYSTLPPGINPFAVIIIIIIIIINNNNKCQGTTDASAVEGKKSRTVNFEKWRPSDSSSLTAAGGAIPQWTEDIPSYSWDSDDD